MEPEGLLLCSQVVTRPYPEPDESILHPKIPFLHICLGLWKPQILHGVIMISIIL
jgi:hypothetical protein